MPTSPASILYAMKLVLTVAYGTCLMLGLRRIAKGPRPGVAFGDRASAALLVAGSAWMLWVEWVRDPW